MKCFFALAWLLCVALTGSEALRTPEGHLGLAPLTHYHKPYWLSMPYEQIPVHGPGEPQQAELEDDAISDEAARRLIVPTGGTATVKSEQVNTDGNGIRSHQLPLAQEPGSLLPSKTRTTAFVNVRVSREERENADEQEALAMEESDVSHGRRGGLRRLARALGMPLRFMLRGVERVTAVIKNIFAKVIRPSLTQTTCNYASFEAQARAAASEEGTGLLSMAFKRATDEPVERDLVDSSMTAAVDFAISKSLPQSKPIMFDSVRNKRRMILTRGLALGAGSFGYVVAFTTASGLKLAGKLFMIKENSGSLLKSLKAQFGVVKRLPAGSDAWEASNRLGLVLPLDVVKKCNTDSTLFSETGPDILNAIVLMPLFPMDLDKLAARLSLKNDADGAGLLSLTQQAVKAVKSLHDLELVHLDIKPVNFLISQLGRVYLADLDGVTPIGDLLIEMTYSPLYVSPELARALISQENPPATESMDAWQLGISIYQIWCGRVPEIPHSRKSGGVFDALLDIEQISDSVTMLDPECTAFMPEEVLNLITQLLTVDPNLRLTPKQAVESHPAMFLPVPSRWEKNLEGEATGPRKRLEGPETLSPNAGDLPTGSTLSGMSSGEPPKG